MKIPTRDIEFWLLGWSESHSGGCKVTFQVAADDLEYFKAATIRKGKHAGQRYAAVLVQLNDDNTPDPQSVQPTPPPKGVPPPPAAVPAAPAAGAPKHHSKLPGGYCGLAVQWCGDADFQSWIYENFEGEVEEATKACNPKLKSFPSDVAAHVVKAVCGVTTRTELDTSESAGKNFELFFRGPYMAYLQECKEVV